MPGMKPTPPVGDLYGPFWAMEFYANATNLSQNREGIERRSAVTGEALTIDPNIIVETSREFDRVTAAGGSPQTLSDLQNVLDDFDLSVYKSSLTVTLLGEASSFELTLTPPYDDALSILDNRVIQRSIYVILEWGYVSPDGDVISSGKYAFLASRPSLSFNSGDISIQLAGNDILSSALSKVSRKQKHSRKGGDVVILKKLANEIGYELNTDGVRLASKNGSHPLFSEKDPDTREQNKSDWDFFKEVVRDNRCSLVVGPGDPKQPGNTRPTVFIYDELSALKTQKCAYTFRAYQQLVGEFDVPIINFESQPNPGIFASKLSQSTDGRQADLAKGDTKQVKHDMQKDQSFTTTRNGRTGAGSQKDARKVKTTGGTFKATVATPEKGAVTMSGPSRDPDFLERLRKLTFDQSVMANVKANVTVPGLVGLSSDMNVNVRGLGESMSGVYRVTRVEHTIGQGYETTAALVRHHLTDEHTEDTAKAIGPKIDEGQECLFTKVEPPRKLEGSR